MQHRLHSLVARGAASATIALAAFALACGRTELETFGDGPGAPPQRVAPTMLDRQLAAGAFHSCLLVDRSVKCWGRAREAQTGVGRHDGVTPPTSLKLPPIAQIALGEVTTVFLGVDGDVSYVGVAEEQGSSVLATEPTRVATGGVRLFSKGQSRHHCYATADGSTWCWGLNQAGQIRSPLEEPGPAVFPPVAVRELGGARDVALGNYFTCGLTSDSREVRCAGFNSTGQLGDGSLVARAEFRTVAGLADSHEIFAGAAHACAVTRAEQMFCWGNNAGGQLGDGTTTMRPRPVRVHDAPTDARQIVAGRSHTCVLSVSRGVPFCWGANSHGQLGDGTRTPSLTAHRVPAIDDVAALAAAGDHTCALKRDHTVWCWGDNANGQTGAFDLGDTLSPTRVAL